MVNFSIDVLEIGRPPSKHFFDRSNLFLLLFVEGNQKTISAELLTIFTIGLRDSEDVT